MSEAETRAQAAKATFIEIVSDAVNEWNDSGAEAHEIATSLIDCIGAIVEKSTKPNLHRIVVCFSLMQKFDSHIKDLLVKCIKE